MGHEQVDPKFVDKKLAQYDISQLNQQQRYYSRTCAECGDDFTTTIQQAVHCGTCNTTAQVLYVHYIILMQKYKYHKLYPNRLVERVFNAQAKPFRRLLQGG